VASCCAAAAAVVAAGAFGVEVGCGFQVLIAELEACVCVTAGNT